MRIENEQDGFSLVTEDEEDIVLTLSQVDKRLKRLAKVTDVSEEKQKYEFLRGILYFKLQSDFKPRLWAAQFQLREVDKALGRAKKAKRALVRAANKAPKSFEGYSDIIDGHRRNILNLLSRLDLAIGQQEQHIQRLALTALIKTRQYLENYHVRARFSIARIYDSIAIEKDKKTQEEQEQPEQDQQQEPELQEAPPENTDQENTEQEKPEPESSEPASSETASNEVNSDAQ